MRARPVAEVVQAVSEVIGEVQAAEHVPTGFGNENWRITTGAGDRYVAKFGPRFLEPKWRSAQVAQAMAVAAGVPAPRLVHFGYHGDDELLRMFGWIEGDVPTADLSADASRHLLSELGAAIGVLHSIGLDRFSSRIDGSGPSFERWSDYVSQRLIDIRRRCLTTQAVELEQLEVACALIAELAGRVSEDARPTLCHRDLHGGNLLVDPEGGLVAILDFDMAESWDAAGEWFKLNRMLFPLFDQPGRPEAATVFLEAYQRFQPQSGNWVVRTRVVELLEALNLIPNAISAGFDAAFEQEARGWLASLLAAR